MLFASESTSPIILLFGEIYMKKSGGSAGRKGDFDLLFL